jgi:DNA-directed RNA polymerase beta' subunit
MMDIKTKFVQFWDVLSEASGVKKKSKISVSNIVHGCIMTSYDNSDDLIVHFRFELVDVRYSILQEIAMTLLQKLYIKGNDKIRSIKKVHSQQVIKYDEDGKLDENAKEWVIYTDGVDINFVRNLVGVDLKRTYCNDINVIYNTFGIEAARTALINEFKVAFSGNDVNFAHYAMLVDTMTNNGRITSMNRFGINRLDTAPLGRITFEKTMEQFAMACAFNENDYLNGVSSRIMAGRCIKGGTCSFEVDIDLEMVQNSEIDETKEVKMIGTQFKEVVKGNVLDELRKHRIATYKPV